MTSAAVLVRTPRFPFTACVYAERKTQRINFTQTQKGEGQPGAKADPVTHSLLLRLHELDSELGRLWVEVAELERHFEMLRPSPAGPVSTDYLRAYV